MSLFVRPFRGDLRLSSSVATGLQSRRRLFVRRVGILQAQMVVPRTNPYHTPMKFFKESYSSETAFPSPFALAHAAICAREVTFSFTSTLLTCVATVRSLRTRTSAIWRFDFP